MDEGKTIPAPAPRQGEDWSEVRGNPAVRSGSYTLARDLRLVVGRGRLELPPSQLSVARSNQLSYRPKLMEVTGL